jgi:hypothetical protein
LGRSPVKALDFSNYDSDVPFDSAAIVAFGAEGFRAFLLGCQNPAIASHQAAVALAGGMEPLATYIEPFTAEDAYEATIDGIAMAIHLGVPIVYAACERGGVTGIDELRAIRGQVEAAGLVLGIYTGKPTWQSLFANTTEFADCPLWFAAYWDDGRLIEEVDFGGWTKVTIHQYASSPAIAGRNRDRNEILIQEGDMAATPDELFAIQASYKALIGGIGGDYDAQMKAFVATGNSLITANAKLQERVAKLEAAAKPGALPDHKHTPGGVA